MRPRRSRSRSLALGLALGLAALLAPAAARAQACCAGSTALVPGRLNMGEDALAAVQVRGTGVTGSFDAAGRFVRSPRGATEIGLEQDLIATVRVLEDGQLSILAPVVETVRRLPGASDAGGGLGDLQYAARWDFTITGMSPPIPGIAVLASLTLPTGVAPEQARRPLGTDATGTGAFHGAFGAALEQTFGRVLINVTGSVTIHSARSVQGMHAQLGPTFSVFGALGWWFDGGAALALTASYLGELATRNDGVAVPDSGRALLRLGLSGGYSFSSAWRLQASVFGDPPAPHAGQNQPAGVGGAATLLRTW